MTGTIRCPSCGVAIESDASSCPFCGATVRPESKEIATGEDRKVHRATHRDRAAEAMTRYSEGYLYARTINGLGSFIQVVSCLVGGLLVLGGLFACLNSSQNNPFAGQLGAASGTIMAISGVVVGFLGVCQRRDHQGGSTVPESTLRLRC